MKKILAIILMTVSVSAFAWNHGYYGYRGPVYVNNYGYNNNWVAPAVAGVLVGAALARPYYAQPVTYVQQPVYVQPPVTYVQQANPAPLGYTQQQILDANCNCWRTVLVPN